jgi:hypothetical protein
MLPKPPYSEELVPDVVDDQNLLLSLIEQENFNNDSFVDDSNGVCAIPV